MGVNENQKTQQFIKRVQSVYGRRVLRPYVMLIVSVFLPVLFTFTCQDQGTARAKIFLQAWAHSGREAERLVMEKQVARFNNRQDSVRVRLTFIPEGAYNAQVQATALAADLPDVLEFDGPFLYSFVWQNHLRPIDEYLARETPDNVLESVKNQGTYRQRLYSLGQFDSGLGLFGRRGRLEAAGARIPQGPEDAWSVQEFESILARPAENDPDGQVLDLKLNYGGEWYTCGFSPVLWSAAR